MLMHYLCTIPSQEIVFFWCQAIGASRGVITAPLSYPKNRTISASTTNTNSAALIDSQAKSFIRLTAR